jgi:hypothetical protein
MRLVDAERAPCWVTALRAKALTGHVHIILMS